MTLVLMAACTWAVAVMFAPSIMFTTQIKAAQKAAAAGAPPEERDDDDAEGDAAAASASYDYLLSMPIHSLTHEKARRPCYASLVAPCPPVCMVLSGTLMTVS